MNRNIRMIFIMVVIVLVVGFLFFPVAFAKEINERAEKSDSGHLNLFEGDRGKWEVTKDSAGVENIGRLSIPRFKLNYILGQFFVGFNAHYQKTKYLKDWDYTNYGNWRIGGQIGILF